jgi:hypothetical protein
VTTPNPRHVANSVAPRSAPRVAALSPVAILACLLLALLLVAALIGPWLSPDLSPAPGSSESPSAPGDCLQCAEPQPVKELRLAAVSGRCLGDSAS